MEHYFNEALRAFFEAEDRMLACYDNGPEAPHPSIAKKRAAAENAADRLRVIARQAGSEFVHRAEYHLGKNFGLPKA